MIGSIDNNIILMCLLPIQPKCSMLSNRLVNLLSKVSITCSGLQCVRIVVRAFPKPTTTCAGIAGISFWLVQAGIIALDAAGMRANTACWKEIVPIVRAGKYTLTGLHVPACIHKASKQ